MKIKKKIIFIIIVFIIFVIICITAAFLYKNRNTVTVYPTNEIAVNNAIFFYQNNTTVSLSEFNNKIYSVRYCE